MDPNTLYCGFFPFISLFLGNLLFSVVKLIAPYLATQANTLINNPITKQCEVKINIDVVVVTVSSNPNHFSPIFPPLPFPLINHTTRLFFSLKCVSCILNLSNFGMLLATCHSHLPLVLNQLSKCRFVHVFYFSFPLIHIFLRFSFTLNCCCHYYYCHC